MSKKSIYRLISFCITIIIACNILCICKINADEEKVVKYAKSAVLIDGDSGRILYEKSAHNKVSVASTTKIMTCIIVIENGNLGDMVTPSDYAIAMPKVKMHLDSKDKYKLEDLLYAMMLESYNDVAVAVAEHIAGSVEKFAELMNIKAKDIGMKDTNFVTPNGLDAKNQYSTAYDMALLGMYATNNELFVKITNTRNYSFVSENGRRVSVSNKDAFLDKMSDAIGIKTGFTGNAGYCFVGALKNENKKLISCVLACGWPPNKGYKWNDTLSLMKYGENYNYKEIVDIQNDFVKYDVRNGVENILNTYTNEKFGLLLKNDDKVDKKIVISKKNAPIFKNEVVGYENIYVNNIKIKAIEIKAKHNIKKYEFKYCLKKFFLIFFSLI
ncbi:D-alanyl-D-alanine carboxypeptidase family protein [Eubacterium sp. AF17-7]|jgi:D-alanyl-D-alanine carboxypeptidase (penicillin-binding protein 5/6)|uniref:D-alanyl-D-alanine carboxypeptidase family protein n=1 Tax=Eubacterium TaxID=1730 RepID=UPI000E466B6C|nr:D-alanyl-D-alanine carboxypeptidase family protein [Eubacterium sp. AF17-7]RGG66744.1 D-alanyl-D-alanine carboxypeptidase [Eubacterium sp. AF17-7]